VIFLFHPLIVHFPVALWMTGALFDLLFIFRRDQRYAATARTLIGLGLIAAGPAIVAGWVDLRRQVELGVGTGIVIQHRVHSVLAYGATAAYLAVFLGRWRTASVPRWTLALSLLGALLVGAVAWVGAELRRVM
jgi:uncharacterized membrane protein